MVIVAAVTGLGCLAALLPAQESSRRTASKYRSEYPGGTSGRPNLSPPAAETTLPPIVSSRGKPGGEAPAQFPGAFPAQETSEAGDAPSTELDDGRLKSVLKRPRSEAAEMGQPAMLPPPTYPSAPPPAASNVSNELLRRVESGPDGTAKSSPVGSVMRPATTTTRSGQIVSASNKSAALRVEISGPQGVTVGKPSPYSITVTNDSDTTAEDVQVRLTLPSWVSVQAVQPSHGEAGAQADGTGSGRLVWNLSRVAGRGSEQLKLQIVTREADGFELGAEWTSRATATRAAILVKQPQLALALAGPADMTFGEEKTFTLTVSNPGTGDAERVVVTVSSGSAAPQQFDAGVIPAGHKKEVPLSVVASQTGSIDLTIAAAAETVSETRTSHKITVRKAEINVAIEGPPLKYAGTEAIYQLAVTNQGSATADNVNLFLSLPAGAKYLGGIDGATTSGNGLKWRIASLGPGVERSYDVRLLLGTAGTNRLEVQSQAAASGTATCFTETTVEAISDLKLVVNDPAGPTPIGEQAVYELQLVNRGSRAARQVKIVMQFSDGVEPISFEGCEARLVPGQVLCQPLAQLGPGEQATMKIKAQANQAGAHHFRVEVTTADDDSRLVSEGTTRFFADGGRGAAASTARRSGTSIPTTTVR
jgi:uncharacterized repeat protein (TIGR01451 family)